MELPGLSEAWQNYLASCSPPRGGGILKANWAAAPNPLLSTRASIVTRALFWGASLTPSSVSVCGGSQLRLPLTFLQLRLVKVCKGVSISLSRPLKVAVGTCDPAVLDQGHCLLLNVPKLEPESKLILCPSNCTPTHVDTRAFYILG